MGETQKIINVKLVYFTGTGGTQRVADCFERAFKKPEVSFTRLKLQPGQDNLASEVPEDLLLILYPVHALNAPEPIYQWISRLKQAKNTPTAVISVSGGGEVTPNTACRLHCIKRLEKKGYRVTYEAMLVMPSNFITSTADGLAIRLLEVLPARVEKIVNDLLSGVNRRTKPNRLDRILSVLGEIEKSGSKMFGKSIKVTYDCSGCGWCAKNCPQGNIRLDSGKPVFSSKCVLCLKCIYDCPKGALKPGIMGFIVINQGFKIDDIEQRMTGVEPAPVEELAQGYIWKGVRNYLLESEQNSLSESTKSTRR